MKYLLSILFVLFSCVGYGHDIRMAIFEISEDNKNYTLDISFDKKDLERSLITAYPELLTVKDNMTRESYIKDYLESNFQLAINNKCIAPNIEAVTYEDEYVRIHATLPIKWQSVETINVFNTCLLDYNEGHSNIIKVRLNKRTRTFRLSAERITTVVDYRE
ncbi:hypothetical protein LVD17_06410 [Fulvivirga ulvae]|uniref:DUF6702 family protein n=1 Tax=Fulvivirga ulvae TaxID=2904245 RepID=UPI001F176025|nr:DUF6702 family protein [Fulvivirga ulvae]UII33454.1 hypothetical protein LVD17_06410 [Fulvivirga ulvae]